jgi:hypothetical protein
MGSSVVSPHGVIASLAVTEVIVFTTGVARLLKRLLRYDVRGGVTEPEDPPRPDSPYCTLTGDGDQIDWHIRAGLRKWVR